MEMVTKVGGLVIDGKYDHKKPEEYNAMRIEVAKILQKEGYSLTEWMSSNEEIRHDRKLDDKTYAQMIEIDEQARVELLNEGV
jgi:hypothetical protein